MPKILNDLLPDLVIRAIESNIFEFFRAIYDSWKDGEIYDEPHLLWTISDIPSPMFNSVLRANLEPDAVPPIAEMLKEKYVKRCVSWMWQVGPASRPIKLGNLLIDLGFRYFDDTPGMAVDLNKITARDPWPEGLEIHQVSETREMRVFERILSAAFGLPEFVGNTIYDSFSQVGFDWRSPIQHFLGYIDNEPVATSTLFQGAGVAGIYNVSTSPHARRRGIGAALTVVPLLSARGRGYRIGILQSSREGLSVYAQLGFEEYCLFEKYLWVDE